MRRFLQTSRFRAKTCFCKTEKHIFALQHHARLYSSKPQQEYELDLDDVDVDAGDNEQLNMSPEKMNEIVKELTSAIEVEKNPKIQATMLNNLGVIYERQNNFEKAVQTLMQSMSLNPEDSAVYANLGILFQRTKRWKTAIAMYEKVLQLNPKQTETKYRLAMLLGREDGQFSRTKKLLLECADEKPSFTRPIASLAMMLAERVTKEDQDLSLSLADKLIANNDPAGYHVKAYCFVKQERFSEADKMYAAMINQFPESAEAYAAYASLKSNRGDHTTALKLASKAHELDKTNAETCLLLARVLEENKRYEEAEHILRQMLKADDTNPMIYTVLMNVLVQQSQFEAAFQLLDNAEKKHPKLKEQFASYKQYVAAFQEQVKQNKH